MATCPSDHNGPMTRPPADDVDHAAVEALLATFPEGIGALCAKLGITVVSAHPERVVARMPVAGNTQAYGLLHGGASVVLAETVGSLAAVLHAGPDRLAVGVDVNATHHRAVRSGEVVAVATPLHRGRSMASYQVTLTDPDGRLVCTARLTCALVPARPG